MKDHAPGQNITNFWKISQELGDLTAAMEMLYDEGIISRPLLEDIRKKKIKVEHYLGYSKNVGKLED